MIKKILFEVYELLLALAYTVKNLPRDLNALITLTKVKKKLAFVDKHNINVFDYFYQWVRSQPDKACLVFNESTWTFGDLEDYANKIANLFQKNGLKKGDVVALLMENKPEYIGIWLGLSRLGVITACINTNLRSKSLIHSITVAKPKVLIYGSEMTQAVSEISLELPDTIHHIAQKDSINDSNLDNVDQLEMLLKPMSSEFIPSENIQGNDVLMYVYTSGTTGLPKPAVIKHSRYISAGFSFFDVVGLTTDDVFFVTLPVYHSNAGFIGIGAALISGATVVMRRKFSASNFWKECIQYNVTAFAYVGEVCRYLVNQPVSKLDKAHSVRLCVGNGTRANVHKEFSERFGIKLMEFYASTEGNCTLINNVAKLGACGYLPRINRYFKFLPTFVIKIDQDMNPVRDSNGHCIYCEPNEKGLLVGLIDNSTARQQYNGYANSADASNKKVIKDLFKTGQMAFNTGDLVMADKDGYIYFCDRLGDTYRWRGENVSTVEVENLISSRLDSTQVVVYGVEINGQEGKAGMATLMKLDANIKKLGEHLQADLPSYAKPLFLRLNDQVDHTGSLKVQKSRLVNEGFNVNLFTDKTFYFDARTKSYNVLTRDIYDDIQNGKIRM